MVIERGLVANPHSVAGTAQQLSKQACGIMENASRKSIWPQGCLELMSVRQYCFVAAFLVFSWTQAAAQTYNINALVGNGTSGYTGDGGSAASAEVNQPGGIAFDSSGKIYIADTLNHRVRVISNGTITTFAGNGTAGYTGDGNAATSAELNAPVCVGVDQVGNIYICDYNNNVVRQVTTDGKIHTWAGNGTGSYAGDNGPAGGASLFGPLAVVFDSLGNGFIVDSLNNVVREVYSNTSTTNTPNVIITLVGSLATKGQISHPAAIAIDSSGSNLYIADSDNRRIVKFTISASTFSTFAGNEAFGFSGDNGPATAATLFDPEGVAIDSAGNVYISDTLNGRIRKVAASTGIITTIAGNGSFGFSGDGGAALNAAFYFPRQVAVDKSGNVYVSDSLNHEIRILSAATPHITSNGVVNAASYVAQLSPGSLGSIFGSSFGTATATAGAPLPLNLSGISVTVNGRSAPVLAVTPGQINFQVPWATEIGSASVVVSVNGTLSNTASVPVVAAAPGLFAQSAGRALVQNADYSVNTAQNPAKMGTTIVTYVNGSGPVSSSLADGSLTPMAPPIYSTAQVSATIGNENAQVSFAGLAPGMVGLMQMNIQVPSDLAGGNYPLTVSINGAASNSGIISLAQ